MPQLPRVSAVLFDMDGTLVDSDAAVDRAWITWSSEYGLDPEVVMADATGHPSSHTVAKVLGHLDPAAQAEATARQLSLEYDDLSDVTAAEGAHELLARLAEFGIPWAVVTSADTRLAKARLGVAGIAPAILVTCEDVPLGKPDPAGYLLAAELLGVKADDCLVVEDAVPGVAAGRAAGATVAALKGVPGDLQIGSLTQLTELFG